MTTLARGAVTTTAATTATPGARGPGTTNWIEGPTAHSRGHGHGRARGQDLARLSGTGTGTRTSGPQEGGMVGIGIEMTGMFRTGGDKMMIK